MENKYSPEFPDSLVDFFSNLWKTAGRDVIFRMEVVVDKKVWMRIFVTVFAGFLAGFVNGLAGTGAGVIFLLFWGMCGGGITREGFSLSMASVLPLSVVSLLTYAPPTDTVLGMIPVMVVAAGVGGICGSWIQKHIRVSVLKMAFALLVIWAGARMILR